MGNFRVLRISEMAVDWSPLLKSKQVCISLHLFPEEWNHDIPQTPTGPDADGSWTENVLHRFTERLSVLL
jgi:hypothetical protein